MNVKVWNKSLPNRLPDVDTQAHVVVIELRGQTFKIHSDDGCILVSTGEQIVIEPVESNVVCISEE